MKKILVFFLSCLLLITSGCSSYRPSIEEAQEDGAKQLGKQNIKDLVMNNELQMVSWDKSVEAMIQFDSKGKLTATNNIGESTHGQWSANSENKLCLKFRFWDDNIQKCYDMYQSNTKYLMFHSGNMEYILIPGEDSLSTLADMNVGVMGSPPPQRSTVVVKKSAQAPVDEAGSFMSAVTFGLWGNEEKEEKKEEAIPFKKEFTPEPIIVPVKKLSTPHQQLLDTGDCPGCDLKGVDLQGANLKGANLAGADLQGANLQEANLKGANLKGTDFESARLTDAILVKANLQGANLSDANLHWADLTKADLRGANLTRCYMVKAIFYKADLTGADLTGAQTQRTIFEQAEGVPEHILKRTDKKDDAEPLK